MSRIGRMPINLPPKVTCVRTGEVINVTGPLGKLAWTVPSGVKIVVKDNVVTTEDDLGVRLKARDISARRGLVRATIQNMVTGVVTGFEKKLEMRGQGYRPTLVGNKLTMTLGYSQPSTFVLPDGVKGEQAKVETGNRGEERYLITLKGCDRVLIGEVAAKIRKLKVADAYKGKGIRYFGEFVKQKPGKATVAAGGAGGK